MSQIDKAREAIRLKGLIAKARIDLHHKSHPTDGIRKIGKAIGLTPNTVRYHLRQMGMYPLCAK